MSITLLGLFGPKDEGSLIFKDIGNYPRSTNLQKHSEKFFFLFYFYLRDLCRVLQ